MPWVEPVLGKTFPDDSAFPLALLFKKSIAHCWHVESSPKDRTCILELDSDNVRLPCNEINSPDPRSMSHSDSYASPCRVIVCRVVSFSWKPVSRTAALNFSSDPGESCLTHRRGKIPYPDSSVVTATGKISGRTSIWA